MELPPAGRGGRSATVARPLCPHLAVRGGLGPLCSRDMVGRRRWLRRCAPGPCRVRRCLRCSLWLRSRLDDHLSSTPRMLLGRLSTGGFRVLGCVGCSILNRCHGSRDRTSLRPHRPRGGRGRRAGCGRAVPGAAGQIRSATTVIADQEIATLRGIAEWAAEHVVDDEAAAATLMERGLDTGLPLAGPGAPLISDFAVMDSPRCWVGRWTRVATTSARSSNWRTGSRRSWPGCWTVRCRCGKPCGSPTPPASCPEDAAAYVDRQIAPVAHGCTWAQIDRLVEEALVRYDPELPRNAGGRRTSTATSTSASTRRLRRHRPRHHRPGRCRRPGPGNAIARRPSSTASSAMRTPSTSAAPKRSVRSPART